MGGQSGATGVNALQRNGIWQKLPAKCDMQLLAGDRLRLQTPGGGGFGEAENYDQNGEGE